MRPSVWRSSLFVPWPATLSDSDGPVLSASASMRVEPPSSSCSFSSTRYVQEEPGPHDCKDLNVPYCSIFSLAATSSWFSRRKKQKIEKKTVYYFVQGLILYRLGMHIIDNWFFYYYVKWPLQWRLHPLFKHSLDISSIEGRWAKLKLPGSRGSSRGSLHWLHFIGWCFLLYMWLCILNN